MIFEICAVIGTVSVVTVCVYVVERLRNGDFLIGIMKDFVAEVVADEDLQKRVYVLGGLIGNGLSQNLNLGQKVSPKTILTNILSNWLQNFGQKQGQTIEAPTSAQKSANYG